MFHASFTHSTNHNPHSKLLYFLPLSSCPPLVTLKMKAKFLGGSMVVYYDLLRLYIKLHVELWANRTMYACTSIVWLHLKGVMCVILHYFTSIGTTICLWSLLCLPPPFQSESSFKIRYFVRLCSISHHFARGIVLNCFQFKIMEFVVTNEFMSGQLWTTILKFCSLMRFHSICHHLSRGTTLNQFSIQMYAIHWNK